MQAWLVLLLICTLLWWWWTGSPQFGGSQCSNLDQRDCYKQRGCRWCITDELDGSCRKWDELGDCAQVYAGRPLYPRSPRDLVPPSYFYYPSYHWNWWNPYRPGWGWRRFWR